jgi:hypothetical protein
LKGKAQQAIASENGHGLAKDLMAGWPAAAKVVVIHCGKVVVDERVGMDHLHGTSRRHCRRKTPSTCLSSQQHEHRTQTFPRGQEAVANRLAQSFWTRGRQTGALSQRSFNFWTETVNVLRKARR